MGKRKPDPQKAVLYLEIGYDGNVTDHESVASALDQAMETALSTPDLLDEYGSPTVGAFYVLPPEDVQAALDNLEGLADGQQDEMTEVLQPAIDILRRLVVKKDKAG